MNVVSGWRAAVHPVGEATGAQSVVRGSVGRVQEQRLWVYLEEAELSSQARQADSCFSLVPCMKADPVLPLSNSLKKPLSSTSAPT